MKEQVSSRLAKSAVVQYVTVFRRILANKTGETLILGLRRKGIILRALMWAVTSLWPQKVVCRSQFYSTRAKLMLICYQARPLCVPFKKRFVFIRDLEKIDFVRNVCIRMMIYLEKARVIEGE